MRIKIKRIDIIDKNDLLKRVEYCYSLEGSSGILKIEQSLYNELDEFEYFMKSVIPNLYKYDKKALYIYYYKNFKYSLYPDGSLVKYRMY